MLVLGLIVIVDRSGLIDLAISSTLTVRRGFVSSLSSGLLLSFSISFVLCLGLVIGEFNLIIGSLLVIYVGSIRTLYVPECISENKR